MLTEDGFILINKVKGCTSHDCVKDIRKLLKIKRVGHTGTLDPQVSGLLPIAVGSATKFIQYLPQEKTYHGKIKLGLRTKTDDIFGELIKEKEWPKLSFLQLDQSLNSFRGKINQVPPIVSSVHHKGERAYKKALRNEEFELSPKPVQIKELILKEWDQENGLFTINITCSTGTYIRSLARDIGKSLNSEGCLYELKRVASSGFHIKNSLKISELYKSELRPENIITPTIEALKHLSTIYLNNENDLNYWVTGRKINFNQDDLVKNSEFDYLNPVKVLNMKGILLGIGYLDNELDNILRPKLVLNAR